MASPCYEASAPGKLMLLGEHAILHGRRCLVGAVNRRLTIRLRPRADRVVQLRSALGELTLSADDPTPRAPFAFLLAALAAEGPLPGGCEIEVESQFGSTIGLGSSGAVTAATLAAAAVWRGLSADPARLLPIGQAVIRRVQGSGSGADLAASLYGGLLLYRADPVDVVPLPQLPPIAAVYAGYKTPTPDVIARVEARRRRLPQVLGGIFDAMDASCDAAAAAVRAADWPALGELLSLNQHLMAAIGVSDPRLAAIVARLQSLPTVHGAKISGSGLGDCVLALGTVADRSITGDLHDLRLAADGVRVVHQLCEVSP